MDPITALTNLIAEITKLATVVIQSQPPDVQKQLWEMHLEDVKAWRKLFKFND